MNPAPNPQLAELYAGPLRTGVRQGEGWLLYALVRVIRPLVVVEVGTGVGSSALWLTQALADNGWGRLHSIDLNECADARERVTRAGLSGFVTFHTTDSRGAEAKALAERVAPIGLLFVDGAHDYTSVRRDIESWAAAVPKGGLVIFHDATKQTTAGVEVWQALAAMPAHWQTRSIVFGEGRGYDAGGPHENGLVILQRVAADTIRMAPGSAVHAENEAGEIPP